MGLQHHKPAEGCRFTHAGKSWAGNLIWFSKKTSLQGAILAANML